MWRNAIQLNVSKSFQRHSYHVLAIESSCDDSAVALINRVPNEPPMLLDHVTKSLDSSAVGGIIPTDAKAHHQAHMGSIVKDLLVRNDICRPDLVCATRGPGMMGSLSVGLNIAKGLSIAWNVPLIGVHHMLGHLLTPRFFTNGETPKFPYLSLLVSGGHTMLVLSKGILEHQILANTIDIAVGDMLDKCGRELGLKGNMIGKELENLIDNHEVQSSTLPSDLTFPNPLQNQKGRVNLTAFSFAGYISSLRTAAIRFFRSDQLYELDLGIRKEIARRVETAIFNHLVTKVDLAIRLACERGDLDANTQLDFVCSGGVASNMHLRRALRQALPRNIEYHFPDPKWCTDNALMIGWAGIELWESCRLQTDLGALSIAKWPLDMIKDADGWIHS